MGIGMRQIRTIEIVQDRAAKLGLQFASASYTRDYDSIALIPLGDALPVYSRDAEVFVGDLEQVDKFLRGVEWSHEYLMLIKATTQTVVARKEQDFRNEQLVRQLKNEPVISKSNA